MARRQSHAPTIYLVRRDTLPTINFTLRDNERPAVGYYLDPQDPETWRPVDTTGKTITGWFKPMCRNGTGAILFGIPVLRHAPFVDGNCTLLGSPSVLMDIPPGWYELEIEVKTCHTPSVQTVWKRFKFCIREDFDTTETDGMTAPIYRDTDGDLVELPATTPDLCPELTPPPDVVIPYTQSSYAYSGWAYDPDGLVTAVQYQVNRGGWLDSGATIGQTINYSFVATDLVVGDNLIEVRSVDNAGGCSVAVFCTIKRLRNKTPVIIIDCGVPTPPEEQSECFTEYDEENNP